MADRNNQDKFKEILGMAAFQNDAEKRAVARATGTQLTDPVDVKHSVTDFDLPIYEDMVKLPTKGLFYAEGHPLHGRTHVEVKQVSGKEEKILTNKDYLKSGVALSNFIKSLIIDEDLKKQKNFDQIVDADRNAILVNARISAFGRDYGVSIVCPSCIQKGNYDFDLANCKTSAGFFDLPEESRADIEHVGGGLFKFTLPTSGLQIVSGVSNQSLVSKIEKYSAVNKNIDFSMVFSELVVSINDTELNFSEKNQVHDALKLSDIWHFKKVIKKISPSFSIEQHWKCIHCELEEDEMEAPITSNFLFPKF